MNNNAQKIKFFITTENVLYLNSESTIDNEVEDLCRVFGVEISGKDEKSIKLESPEFDDIQDAEIWVRDQPFWKPKVTLANIPTLSGPDFRKVKIKDLRDVRNLLLDDEDIVGGLQYAKTIIADHDDEANSDDYYVCGQCCAFFDDDQAALRCFNKALELAPDDPAVKIDKGMLLLKLDQPEEAFSLLREVFKNTAPSAPIWFTIGLYHLSKGHIEKGVNALRLAVEKEPDMGEEAITVGNKNLKLSEIVAQSKDITEVSHEDILS